MIYSRILSQQSEANLIAASLVRLLAGEGIWIVENPSYFAHLTEDEINARQLKNNSSDEYYVFSSSDLALCLDQNGLGVDYTVLCFFKDKKIEELANESVAALQYCHAIIQCWDMNIWFFESNLIQFKRFFVERQNMFTTLGTWGIFAPRYTIKPQLN